MKKHLNSQGLQNSLDINLMLKAKNCYDFVKWFRNWEEGKIQSI